MIPRYQRVMFWTLLLVSAVMAILLIRMRERAADNLQAAANDCSLNAARCYADQRYHPDAAPTIPMDPS